MRELHIETTEANCEAITDILEDRGIDYTTIPDTEDAVHVFFVIPTAAVDSIMEELTATPIDADEYTVIRDAEYAQTKSITDLQERYAASVRKLSLHELHGKIREMQWPYQLYYLGTLLSVIAATAGLLLNQPALVIGSMIIAPQATSALAAPAGVLLGDWELFTSSIRRQTLGLGLAVVGAGAFAWGLRVGGYVPWNLAVTDIQLVSLRLAPTLLSTVGAIIAGIVGAFGYTTEQSTALIGVMIAAAIIPAAAAIGLAIAWAAPLFGFGAFLLLVVNVLAINAGAFATLAAMGYRPTWYTDESGLRQSMPDEKRVTASLMVVGLVVALVATSALTAANIGFGRQASEAVEATLDRPAYERLSITAVTVGYGGYRVTGEPTPVTVKLSRTSNRGYPDLARDIERTIERQTGRDVRVSVRFTESLSANASNASSRQPARIDVPGIAG